MRGMTKLSRRQLIHMAAGGALLLAARPIAAAGPLAESGFVRIGGIDQWIAVQGLDPRNPAILFLHGGPGEAQSPFLNQFLPWERDFTVVNWDQRGAGKTYGRYGPSTPDMTFDRLVEDAIEVAEHVRTRLSQPKLILVGHSAGSFLGVHVIRRRPDLFHAFVGTGQLANYATVVAEQVLWARQQATAAGDQAALKALDEAEALPPGLRRTFTAASAAKKWIMSPPDLTYAKIQTDFLGPEPRPATGDAADWLAGYSFCGSRLAPVVAAGDLATLGLDMAIPFFVIQGREDHITGIAQAKAYAEEVRAPAKAFVPIDGGHYACFTNANQFIAALRRHVRPLVA
jgi:pimeloyl-ACP methyl ester carboxylesterase